MHSYLPQHRSYGPKIKRNTINPNIYRFVQSSFRLCQKIKTEVISTNKKKKQEVKTGKYKAQATTISKVRIGFN